MWEWKTLHGKRKLGTSTFLGILQNKNRSKGKGNKAFSKKHLFSIPPIIIYVIYCIALLGRLWLHVFHFPEQNSAPTLSFSCKGKVNVIRHELLKPH